MLYSKNIKCRRFRPLQDWVILERLPDKKAGAVFIPEKARLHMYGRCKVVAIGPGVVTSHGVRVPCDLKKGSIVGLQNFVDDSANYQFTLNGKKVFAVRERHLSVTVS